MQHSKKKIEELVQIAELSIKVELDAIDEIMKDLDKESIGKIIWLLETKSRMKAYAVAQYVAAFGNRKQPEHCACKQD